MFAKTGSNGSAKLSQRIPAILLALIVLFGSWPVEKARAWSYAYSNGRPGSVSIPTILIYEQNNGCATIYGSQVCVHNLALAGNGHPVAYRSPVSGGAQLVSALYTVQQLNGSVWVNVNHAGPFHGQISATQNYYVFPAPYLQPPSSQGIFRLILTFAWSTTTGISLGNTSIVPNLSSDHRCATIYRLCQSFPGYFRTGGYLTGAW
jgi:hypothetical protein